VKYRTVEKQEEEAVEKEDYVSGGVMRGRGNEEKKPCKREPTETTVTRKVVRRSCRGGGECVQSALTVRRDCTSARAVSLPRLIYYIVCKYLYWETVVVRAVCAE